MGDEIPEHVHTAWTETLLRHPDIGDAVDTELVEILLEATPGEQYQHPLHIDDRQRQGSPFRPLLLSIDVTDRHGALLPAGLGQKAYIGD